MEINLDNLIFNFNSVKNFIEREIKIMAVVKANAYGHGAVQCAAALQESGVECFGVALPEEGLELRESGIVKPIICLGGFWSGQEELIIDKNLTPVLFQTETAETLNEAARKKKLTVDVHIKIDTGMGRIGVRFDKTAEFAEDFKKFKNLRVAGLMTHFAAAEDLTKNEFTNLQIERFEEAVKIFESRGFQPFYKDLANTPGAIAHKNTPGNMVRFGGILYGFEEDILPAGISIPRLRPVLNFYSQITHLKQIIKGDTLGYGQTFTAQRDSLIATIPVGYHDGYRRALSNKAEVIINNTFAPVVGRISMDWTIIDVTDVPAVKLFDKVILIGSGKDISVRAEKLARICETISYEITCGINNRVNRIFIRNNTIAPH